MYVSSVNIILHADVLNAICLSIFSAAPGYVYAYVGFQLTLKRKPVFYVLTLIVPSLVLSLLTVLVFMVPPEAGEKISLSISVLLSFTVFLIILSDSIPQTSVNVPILGKYCQYCSSCHCINQTHSVKIIYQIQIMIKRFLHIWQFVSNTTRCMNSCLIW